MNGKANCAAQLCSVKRVRFEGGGADGERAILVDNGVLSFTVLESRAMDLCDFRCRGENIAFLSQNGLCGFQSSFDDVFPGGMLYTCGLDTVGGRATPVHGKLHNLPAEVERVFCDGEHICLEGSVRQSALFGENLVLRRTIRTEYGSGKVTIDNEIVNEGAKEAEYCLLFHMNLGYPFLDEGVFIDAPIRSTQPRTAWAAEHAKNCLRMGAPTEGEEQVFFHTVQEGDIRVVNPKKGLAVRFSYDSSMLPYFIEWKSMVAGTYALGIEPSTTTLDGDFCKKALGAGGRHCYTFSIAVEN